MNTAAKIALAAYLAVSAVHLFFCRRGGAWSRAVTKVLLMPVLLVYYWMASWTMFDLAVAAILLGWGGDILLLSPKWKLCFLEGLGGFPLFLRCV